MKKIVALLLCGVMLLTLAAGCKKEEATPAVLNETIIHSDLLKNYTLYNYSHVTGAPTLGGLQIIKRSEEGDAATVSVSALAHYANVDVGVTADMAYTRINNVWTLQNITITGATPTVTGAPDQDSVLSMLENYISITGSALAIKGDERHHLNVNVRGATWEMQHEGGAKTAKLLVSMKSDTLTFNGYYTLNFEETGWTVVSEKQENGQYYPLLTLESLKQK